MEYFGCNDEENRINFLRLLLVYEKLEDTLKEGPVDQVNSIPQRQFYFFLGKN